MNIEILSNTEKKGGTNYANFFEMKLPKPIDALNNRDVSITPLKVFYPLTTKNILKGECYVQMKFVYKNFTINSELSHVTNKFIIPDGIYDMDTLLELINTNMEEYNVLFKQNKNKKIEIIVRLDVKYIYVANKTRPVSYSMVHVDLEIMLDPKLKFILGFEEKEKIVFSSHDEGDTKTATFLPNIYEGNNKIFIYCDELDRTVVGDSMSQLLCVVPLQIQGQGSGELAEFVPVNASRKFKKDIIRTLHFHLRDNVGKLISFDSGDVMIQALISQ